MLLCQQVQVVYLVQEISVMVMLVMVVMVLLAEFIFHIQPTRQKKSLFREVPLTA